MSDETVLEIPGSGDLHLPTGQAGLPTGQGGEDASEDAGTGDVDLLPGQEGASTQEYQQDLEEVDYEGKKYSVPKELREALLRQTDYTRKTQEVSEQRQALESYAAQLQQATALQQQYQQEYGQLAMLSAQLEAYQNVDWNRFSDDDPVAAQKAYFQYGRLKDQATQVAAQMQQKHQATEMQQRAERAKLLQQGRSELARDVAGWSVDVGEKIVAYAIKHGISEAEIRGTPIAAHIKIVNKARLYDEMMAKAASKPKDAEPAVPAKSLTGRSAGMRSPDKMSIDEWMKHRNKQLAGN
jgi:hypothetical protein